MRKSLVIACGLTVLTALAIDQFMGTPETTEQLSKSKRAVAQLSVAPNLVEEASSVPHGRQEQVAILPPTTQALRDVFNLTPPAKAQSTVAAPIAPPPPEVAPALNIRFLGSFSAPDGKTSVYVKQADAELEVKVGEYLLNGYLIEAVTSSELHLMYPRLSTRVVVPLSVEP